MGEGTGMRRHTSVIDILTYPTGACRATWLTGQPLVHYHISRVDSLGEQEGSGWGSLQIGTLPQVTVRGKVEEGKVEWDMKIPSEAREYRKKFGLDPLEIWLRIVHQQLTQATSLRPSILRVEAGRVGIKRPSGKFVPR